MLSQQLAQQSGHLCKDAVRGARVFRLRSEDLGLGEPRDHFSRRRPRRPPGTRCRGGTVRPLCAASTSADVG